MSTATADRIASAVAELAQFGYTTQAHQHAVVVIAQQPEAPSKQVIGVGSDEATAYANAAMQARRGWGS